ncbi:hypothetical protein Tco_1472213 [Tanacetum coccineum]
MEEFVTENRANYYSGITSIMVNGKVAYELKGRFLDDLRENSFSETNGEDAVEHIQYFLKIVDPIDLPNVNHKRLRLAIFPISLVRNAHRAPELLCLNVEVEEHSIGDLNEPTSYKAAMLDP